MANAHVVHTLLDLNVKLVKGHSKPEEELSVEEKDFGRQYQSAIGSLMYAALESRSDIAYVVQHLSQFSSSPTEAYWTATKRVMHYLKGSLELRITYHTMNKIDNLRLIGFSDADWASDENNRRLVFKYIFTLEDGTIT